MKALKHNFPLVLLAGAVVLLALVILYKPIEKAVGSVPIGGEYHATSTTAGSFQPETVVQTSNGTLGSVIITGAAAGVINIYDATTSNATLRAASMSSSSMLLASFPASTAAGTYTFDRAFYNGLYVSVVGVMPTTTITFR